ncbi:MAG: hypothetical protein JO304_05860 [Solirubrobacterales bacterium]|nr:hypothetical protein [Solirubrobacterales bacterium]
MTRFPPLRSTAAAAIGFLLFAAPGLGPVSGGSPPVPTDRPRGAIVLTVGGPARIQPVAPGFVGLSFEYWAIPAYVGLHRGQIDPVFIQLIRNLTGGDPPVLRIGGNSTDGTWWPRRGLSPPAGVGYSLTRRWVAATRRMAVLLGARLILGINLEADSAAVAATEAKALLAGVGRRHIEALELGNEPELYATFDWGATGIPGRPKGYGYTAFDRDFTRIARALPRVPLAGPSAGAVRWFGKVGRFLSHQPRVTVATVHRYPLQVCFVTPSSPLYPSIPHLLSAWSTRTLAEAVAGPVKAAHAHGVPLRVDEMNTVSCGDTQVPDITRSFASALWGLDALFQMADVGVDGVNIHSYPGATYELFRFARVHGRWRAVVSPDYYGLLMFARAAPAGSRLLKVSRPARSPLKVWATRAPDHKLRVVVINEGAGAARVAVRGAGLKRTGALERLIAPSLLSEQGITLAGQSFGSWTGSGVPAGRRRAFAVAPDRGKYVFSVPAASAAMLTVAPG